MIRTETLAAAFDVAQLLSTQPVPVGDRVAVIGNSTALGMLAVDACLYAGLRVADGRPQDLGVDVSPEELAAAVRAALARPEVHALVVVYVPIVATTGLPHAAALRSAISQATVPVLATFLAAEGLVEQLVVPAADGSAARGSVPSFRTPERAVAALAHAVRYGSWLTSPAGTVPDLPGIDTDAARDAAGPAARTGRSAAGPDRCRTHRTAGLLRDPLGVPRRSAARPRRSRRPTRSGTRWP